MFIICTYEQRRLLTLEEELNYRRNSQGPGGNLELQLFFKHYSQESPDRQKKGVVKDELCAGKIAGF